MFAFRIGETYLEKIDELRTIAAFEPSSLYRIGIIFEKIPALLQRKFMILGRIQD